MVNQIRNWIKTNIPIKKRLKLWASVDYGVLLLQDGDRIYSPTWVDIKEYAKKTSYRLKTMSTICSCEMCSYPKYNRIEQKKEDKMFLGLED